MNQDIAWGFAGSILICVGAGLCSFAASQYSRNNNLSDRDIEMSQIPSRVTRAEQVPETAVVVTRAEQVNELRGIIILPCQ